MPKIMFIREIEFSMDYETFTNHIPFHDSSWIEVTEKEIDDYRKAIAFYNKQMLYSRKSRQVRPSIRILVQENPTSINELLEEIKQEMALVEEKKAIEAKKRADAAARRKEAAHRKELEEKKKLLAKLQKELGVA